MKLKRAALAGAAMFVIGLGHSFCLPTQFPADAATVNSPLMVVGVEKPTLSNLIQFVQNRRFHTSCGTHCFLFFTVTIATGEWVKSEPGFNRLEKAQ